MISTCLYQYVATYGTGLIVSTIGFGTGGMSKLFCKDLRTNGTRLCLGTGCRGTGGMLGHSLQSAGGADLGAFILVIVIAEARIGGTLVSADRTDHIAGRKVAVLMHLTDHRACGIVAIFNINTHLLVEALAIVDILVIVNVLMDVLCHNDRDKFGIFVDIIFTDVRRLVVHRPAYELLVFLKDPLICGKRDHAFLRKVVLSVREADGVIRQLIRHKNQHKDDAVLTVSQYICLLTVDKGVGNSLADLIALLGDDLHDNGIIFCSSINAIGH